MEKKKDGRIKGAISEKFANWLHGIRSSMTSRMAINFMKLMLICGFLLIIIFIAVYLNVQKGVYSEKAEKMVVNLESRGTIFRPEINPYFEDGISLSIKDLVTEDIIYSDKEREFESFLGLFKQIHIDFEDTKHLLVFEEKMEFQLDGKEYEATLFYNMTSDYFRMWRIILIMALVYLLIMLFIISESKRDNVKVLKPIDDIANRINRLTVLNLNSERLNIEGTNEELKDLAEVFNKLLDRLDVSYENQKQFVSNASHELRTPIAVIQGYANMLHRWGAKDAAVLQESVDAIQNEAAEMQDLVNKLLFLSRHDKRTFKLDKKYFNMRVIIEEMIKETEMVVEDRIIECSALENVEVYGDKQSLKQAVRIFVDNAVKYTVKGDTIRISCRNVSGDCVIAVEDTGIGMQQKDLDNIFDRFYRSDDVRDRKISGHGLGLSIAKLIIVAHAGRIRIRTQYTVGTTFTITLPYIKN